MTAQAVQDYIRVLREGMENATPEHKARLAADIRVLDGVGGRLVHDDVTPVFFEMLTKPSRYRGLLGPAAPVKVTRRQRLAVRVMDLRYALAKRLYPYAFGDDL